MKKDVQVCLMFVCEKRDDGIVLVEKASGVVVGEYSLFGGLLMGHEGSVFWRVISAAGKAELLHRAALLAIESESEAAAVSPERVATK